MAKVTINRAAIERGLGNALERACQEYDRQFREAIVTVQWGWPNETKRRNGATVTSPRDIVDLGTLRDSQRFSIQGLKAEFIWDPKDPETGEEYAAIVYFGFTTGGGRSYKDRKWIEDGAFRRYDPVEAMATEVKREFS